MQRRRRCLARGKFCRDDDVDGGQLVLRQPERLADQPAQPIARHPVAGRLHGHGQADSGMAESIGFDTKAEEPVVEASAARIQRIELQLATQA